MDLPNLPHTLITLAESAESIASGLHEFLPHHTSNASAQITSVIAQLFSLSSGLQILTQPIRALSPPPPYHPSPQDLDHYEEHEEEIADLCYSLDYTFKDFQRIIGDGLLEGREEGWGKGETFRATWRSVSRALCFNWNFHAVDSHEV
ncbi:uncharacterized protein KY384_000750 [Bacidia gigantensis]|uniref:uncharacterized protein n=1 Tax=Bacidia gigantensis TaxID=2732470 RepID=UPI001D049C5D|nr:uncharacterized protein KY384_000750 [Bacidia gigantensis]KAG8525988.1 hypothetical protein KY384_000750 [Bacidia gigantensis]